ncbi:protein kinase domain-containing protein [Archangium lansingense]|uniref:protein kinase domain-containing protein n=1 Tax=Archangium lansingense TaxID=2995310 RepID=UPI003B781C56
MRGDACSVSEGTERSDSFLQEVLGAGPLPLLPIPGERLGGPDGRRYTVLEWIGGGGMGQVFRTRDEVLHREVALKFLLQRPGFGEEALAEARAVARLDHENIVRIFDVSEWRGISDQPGVPFLVMECLEGSSLDALLKRGRLEVRQALGLMEAIAAGLAHAHERHIVHRDLKPSNVFLTQQGTVKLLDFGLCHVTPASIARRPALATAGTPAYMAPEQWRGETQDARTDVWAAGVVLYEMLTGRPPFPGPTLSELRAWVTSPEPVSPVRARHPEVPREVEALLATALAKDPARRFRTALELREELLEVGARLWPGDGAPKQATAQRRQMTLVAFELTGLARRGPLLDAEEVGELETTFHETCAEVIEQHGGAVTLAMGSEVLACFGGLQAREDDAERAVRAGLQLTQGLRDTLQRRMPRPGLSGLSVRGGIHTEWMAVTGRALQGEAPKVAAWLARRAAPGGMVVGDTSWRLVRGSFHTEPLGSHTFEGLSGTVGMCVHRVLREREGGSRFERSRVAGNLSPLVGRERELERLLALWEQAGRGQGAFVLVSGEAGIGKSRLIQELCERVAPAPALLLRVQCWSRFSTRAESPVPELLQDVARFDPESSPARRMRLLEERLRPMGLTLADAHLVGRLLSLPTPDDSPVLQYTPEWRKERTFEALVRLVLYRSTREAPMLLVVEDLHWADSTRLEFLGFLLERIEKARLLVILSARPELQPDWPRQPWLHPLAVERLPAGLAAALVKEVARGHALPEETVQRLVGRTDGIPFFIEEMTRLVLEGGAAASIPVTLRELLLARLDMLPSRHKALAQLCSVLGRDFSRALVAALLELEESVLGRELAGLVEAGLLQAETCAEKGPGYSFRHALLQEAAYQSLSRSARRQYHQRISRVLVERFPALVETKPEVLAYHYTEAGEHALAIGYWERAGVLAIQRQEQPEAQGHLARALELQQGLPDAGPVEELRIRMLLGLAMVHVQGYFTPEVERLYDRIGELISQVGEELPQLALSWWAPFSHYFVRAEFQQAYALAVKLVDLGRRHGQRGLLVVGYRGMASVLFCWGRPREALAYLERVLASSEFTLEEHRTLATYQGIVPRAAALAYGSVVHALLGQREDSRRWAREALELARRVGHPYTTAFTLVHGALAHVLSGDVPEVLELTEQALALSSERGFMLWLSWAALFRGWALSELGRPQEGIALQRQALERWRVLGLRTGVPYNLSLLAEVHLKLGQVQEARAAVEEGLVRGAEIGECNVDARLHQLRGECLRRLGREEDARQGFLRAIAIARQQGAGLFELRATVSLGRQLRELGRPRVARRLLSRALARFEAGGESAHLQAARALLDELQAGGPELAPRRLPAAS